MNTRGDGLRLEVEAITVDSLREYPGNPRVGNPGLIAEWQQHTGTTPLLNGHPQDMRH